MANETANRPPAKQDSAAPSPYETPIDYLKSKGWKCLGNPEWPSAGWLDPTKPLKDGYVDEPVMAMMIDWTATDEHGKSKPVAKLTQVQCQNGQGMPTRYEAAFRKRFIPKVSPVNMQFALLIQMERDMKAQNDK